MSDERQVTTAKVIGAFAIVYVVWGSTYIAIHFAIETIPPLIMGGVRYLIAGAILWAPAGQGRAIVGTAPRCVNRLGKKRLAVGG